MHRELRIWDSVLKGRKLNFNKQYGRWTLDIKTGLSDRLGDGEEDDEDDAKEDQGEERAEQEVALPTSLSPGLNFIYGQYMLNAKAYQSALCEFPFSRI
jgi:hypothetical protein